MERRCLKWAVGSPPLAMFEKIWRTQCMATSTVKLVMPDTRERAGSRRKSDLTESEPDFLMGSTEGGAAKVIWVFLFEGLRRREAAATVDSGSISTRVSNATSSCSSLL